MSTIDDRVSRILDRTDASSALADLCAPFAPAGFEPDGLVVQPDDIPAPADKLLVHHEHMTVALEKHYGQPVGVHVLEEKLEGDIYSRKIFLTPRDSNDVVEWGIVRMDFSQMSEQVKNEILARRLPLGAILISHNVLRRIKPRWFLKFPAGSKVLGLFPSPADARECFGRIGTIYCNNEPAIELIEIVTGV